MANDRSLSGYCSCPLNTVGVPASSAVRRGSAPVPLIYLCERLRERNKFVVSVQQPQQRFAFYRFASFILIVDQVARQANTDAFG